MHTRSAAASGRAQSFDSSSKILTGRQASVLFETLGITKVTVGPLRAHINEVGPWRRCVRKRQINYMLCCVLYMIVSMTLGVWRHRVYRFEITTLCCV